MNYFRTDQLVTLSNEFARCLAEKEDVRNPAVKNIMNKMTTQTLSHEMLKQIFKPIAKPVEEEINNEMETVSEVFDSETVQLNLDDIVHILMTDYDVEEEIAKASVMAVEENSAIGDYFDWCIDNNMEVNLIEEHLAKYEVVKTAAVKEVMDVETAAPRPTLFEFTKLTIEGKSEVNLIKGLENLWRSFLNSVEREETSDFINFKALGTGLQKLFELTSVPVNRVFPKYLSAGKPNLIMTTARDIHTAALTLYFHDQKKKLPEMDEVLMCTEKTQIEEVELIMRRAFSDQKENKIYTILYADKLNYDICLKVMLK